MPIIVIMRSSAMPEEYRDELTRRANLFDDPPQGLLLHARSELTDDGQLSVEAWETTEDHQRFLSERLAPAARSIAGEFDLREQSVETLTTVCVIQPRIAVKLVDDHGDEVRKFVAL